MPSARGKPASDRGRKYEQVYEQLRERVTRPDVDESRPIATEESLTAEFGVSRATVRKALKLLEDQGLVVRRRRLGIFPVRKVVRMPAGLSIDDLRERTLWLSRHSQIRLIACRRVGAPAEVRQRLGLAPDARVLKFERVRGDDAGTLAHLTTYIAPDVAGRVTRAELMVDPPLVLLPNKGVAIERMEQTISAEIASQEMARWLGVRRGAALIRTTRLVLGTGGKPLTYMIARLRADRYELHYTLESEPSAAAAPEVWRVSHGD